MLFVFILRLWTVCDIVQSPSLPGNLLVPEGMPDLFDDEPGGYDSDSPKTKVEVRISNRSHY